MTRLAWSLCAASVAMLLAGWALTVAADDVTPAFDLVVTLTLVTFPVVGALVASRRPENAIGWLFCAAGALFAAAGLADGYATYALAEGLSGGVWAALSSGSRAARPPVFGTPPLLFLLFPGGRPLSRRWRAAVWLAAVATALQAGEPRSRPASSSTAPGLTTLSGTGPTCRRGSAGALGCWSASSSRPRRWRCGSAAHAATSGCSSGSSPPRCCSRSAA